MSDDEVREFVKTLKREKRLKGSADTLLFALKDVLWAYESRPRVEEDYEDGPLTDPLADSQLWRRVREAVWQATGE